MMIRAHQRFPSAGWGTALALLAVLALLLAGCAKQPGAPAVSQVKAKEDPCAGTGVLTQESCDGDELSVAEQELIALVNSYRVSNGLGTIPASPSLSKVANRHLRDLVQNVLKFSYSWSDCEYKPGAIQTYPCMWTAPKRLNTGYPGQGYEIAHAISTGATGENALANWKSKDVPNNMLLSKGSFAGYDWQAVGVAISGPYALVWLGREKDPAAP